MSARDRSEAAVDLLSAEPGAELGASQWHAIDQARVNLFAEATGDHQFIHVDPVRAAAEGPFGGTVAHGFLTLSLLASLASEVVQLPSDWVAVNFSVDGVRFLRPVETGKRVRAHFALVGRSSVGPERRAIKLSARLEVEGAEKPALTVAALVLIAEPAAPRAA